MPDAQARARGAQFLMVAAALVIVVAGLRAIKAVALPLVIAILLAVLTTPMVSWLLRHRVPRFLSVAAAVLANVAVVVVMMFLVGSSIREFSNSVPVYQQRLETEVREGLEWLEEKGISVDSTELRWLRELVREIDEEGPPIGEPLAGEPAAGEPEPTVTGEEAQAGGPNSVIDIRAFVDVIIDGFLAFIGTALRGLAELMTMILLIIFMMIFILIEASGMPGKLRLALGWREEELARLARARREIQRYLGIKTLVSLTTGALIGLWVWLMGVDFPLLWGLIAFLLNYIPNIGSFVAAIPTVLLTMIQLGPGRAFLVALGYLVVNVVLGNLVEPQLMGRRLGLSTLVVFLSLVFWGWVWGPIGMLLSVPITMVLKISLEHSDDLRWVAQLVSSHPLPAGPTAGKPA